MLFHFPKTLEIILYGLFRKCVKLSPFYLAIFINDLVLTYLDKLWIFRWVRIAHRLWLICSSFMKRFHAVSFWRKQSEVVEAFSSRSRYLDDLLNIDNNFFDGLISQIYPLQLQLNKTKSSETEAPILALHLSILDRFISWKFMIPRCYWFWDCKKRVREKSRECHNHKPQPFADPKRKRKPTNLNKHKPNKRTKSTKISSLFPKRGNCNTKRTEKHKNKMTHGKTYNKSPRKYKPQSNKE